MRPLAHDVNPVADVESYRQLLLDEDDGDAAAANLAHYVDQPRNDQGRQAFSRLVDLPSQPPRN
jgi:hypothetical protein